MIITRWTRIYYPVLSPCVKITPNPARDRTTFKFDIPVNAAAGKTTLAVYDLSGRRVATVLSENLPPGRYNYPWVCASETGAKLSPGVYVYVLKTSETTATRKIVITGR